jgi:hypothetical protein
MEPPQLQPWSQDMYVTTARTYARPGDVLVSYDNPNMSVRGQIEQALMVFDEVGVQDLTRDLLIHPNRTKPKELAMCIAKHASDFDIIGLTEKDIGQPWFLGAAYIQELRGLLDQSLERYVPIHVFGCLDPKTLPYLFLAGADIFDGLAWMRYYFHGGHALYAKEIEYDLSPDKLRGPNEARNALLTHNIEELEQLRSDLQYSVSVADADLFSDVLEQLVVLEEARVSVINNQV